jgi:hypothetical protein
VAHRPAEERYPAGTGEGVTREADGNAAEIHL